MNLKELTPFGIKVKQKLLELRITQSEFCELHQIPMNRLSEMMYGTRPGSKYREKIIEILNLEEVA